MLLIILGIIAFLISFSLAKSPPPLPRYAGTLRGVALAVIILGFLTACVKQIGAGQVGVCNHIKNLFVGWQTIIALVEP